MRPSENRPSRPKKIVKYVESSSEEEQDESTEEETSETPRASSSRRKAKRKKTEEDDASCLPPEFRSAGLVANMEIPKGKIFGPFSGVINANKEPPTSFFTLVCKVKDAISHKFNYFYTKKAETHKSDWLKMIQAPHGNQDHNFTAYNTEKGVCYEAINHISAGEELLVLFQEDKLGAPKKCTILTPKKRHSVIKSTKATKTTESGSKNVYQPVPAKKERRRRKGAPKKVVKNFLGSDEPFDVSNSDEEDQAKKQSHLNTEVEEQLSAIGGTPEKKGDKEGSSEASSRLRKRRRISTIDLNDLMSSAEESVDSEDEEEERPSDKEFDPTAIVTEEGSTRCTRCKIDFSDNEGFEEHIKTKKCNKGIKCPECGEILMRKRTLKKHMFNKHTTHSCQFCKDKFPLHNELLKHIREKHSSEDGVEKGIKCTECDEILISKKSMKRHIFNKHTTHSCQSCDEKFSLHQDYCRHVREKHSTEDEIYTHCDICKKRFTKTYINEHRKAHMGGFKCHICGKDYSCGSNLRKHIKKHDPDYKADKYNPGKVKKVKCDECDKVLAGSYALKAHMRLHTGERPFKCDKCASAFVQRGHLIRHKKSLHGIGNHAGHHQCETCQRWFTTEFNLQMHVDTAHKGLRPFKCDQCTDTFNVQGLLLRHQRELHQMIVDLPEDQRKYICKIEECGKKFSLQSDLNKHIIEHTGKHPFQCKECDSCFSSSGNLGKHVRRIHRGERVPDSKPKPDGTYQCDLCEKIFSNKVSLREHARFHTGDRIKCSKCSSTFVQRSGLRKHLRCLRCPGLLKELEERGEMREPRHYKTTRSWKCDQCDKCFAGPSDLRSHSRVHTGERPFECGVCGKAFTQPGNLTKHEKYVHGGEKRPRELKREKKFACSLCCKSFASPGDLSMHCRSHTGVKPFECTNCGMAFTQKGNLKKHFARWHTPNASKKRRKPGNSASQKEKLVIKGLSTTPTSTSNTLTCSVVIPASFITDNKEVLVTNVPVSMAAMLKQKATEVANASEPSPESVTALIQCLTASQIAGKSSTSASSVSETATPTENEDKSSNDKAKPSKTSSKTTTSTVSTTSSKSTQPKPPVLITTATTSTPDAHNAPKSTFPTYEMPKLPNFSKLTEDTPASSVPSIFPLEQFKHFLPSRLSTTTDATHTTTQFSGQPPASNCASKDIHRVQDLLSDSSLLDIGAQKVSNTQQVSTPSLNFTGDFTGQVRGMEFGRTDNGNQPTYRIPTRNPLARFPPDSPKGLQLPFDGQYTASSFLNSPRLTHPDIPRQSRTSRREAFPDVLESQSDFSAAVTHAPLQHSFSNASLPQPMPAPGNYFQSPGKILSQSWEAANLRDPRLHTGENPQTMGALLGSKSFQIIGNSSSDVRK